MAISLGPIKTLKILGIVEKAWLISLEVDLSEASVFLVKKKIIFYLLSVLINIIIIGCGINSDDVRALFEGLEDSTSLKYLNLSSTYKILF